MNNFEYTVCFVNICIFWPDLFSRSEKNIGLFNIYCKLMVVDCQVNSELHLFCTRPYLPFCSLDKGVSRKFWPPQTFLVTNLKRQWKISNHQKTLCYWAFQNYFCSHHFCNKTAVFCKQTATFENCMKSIKKTRWLEQNEKMRFLLF